MGGGGWRYILGEWGWVKIFYGCVRECLGMVGGIFWVSEGRWTLFYVGWG